MQRIKTLNNYQKVMLILTSMMIIGFTIAYSITASRLGFKYKNVILMPYQENNKMIYSGMINEKQAIFTVYQDKTVEFQYGEEIFGPYTAKEDPTAIPKEITGKEALKGIELFKGDEVIFRGGFLDQGESRWLYQEDGSVEDSCFDKMIEDTAKVDEYEEGDFTMEPSVFVIIDLMAGPELSHKGDWELWLMGEMLSILTVILILFADEIFRMHLSYLIRNVEQAEPSNWELMDRYVSWTVLPILAFVLFMKGLK